MLTDGLLAAIRDSVAAPANAVGHLLRLRLPLGRVVELAVLVSILDALIAGLLGGGSLVIPTLEGGEAAIGPLVHAVMLVATLVLSAGAVQVAGQVLGGRGTFTEALLVIAWLEVIALAVQAIQLLALLALPPLAPLVGLAGVAVLLWCLVHFVRGLHRFDGWGRAVGTLVLALVAMAIALSMVLGLFLPAAEAAHV